MRKHETYRGHTVQSKLRNYWFKVMAVGAETV